MILFKHFTKVDIPCLSNVKYIVDNLLTMCYTKHVSKNTGIEK